MALYKSTGGISQLTPAGRPEAAGTDHQSAHSPEKSSSFFTTESMGITLKTSSDASSSYQQRKRRYIRLKEKENTHSLCVSEGTICHFSAKGQLHWLYQNLIYLGGIIRQQRFSTLVPHRTTSQEVLEVPPELTGNGATYGLEGQPCDKHWMEVQGKARAFSGTWKTHTGAQLSKLSCLLLLIALHCRGLGGLRAQLDTTTSAIS